MRFKKFFRICLFTVITFTTLISSQVVLAASLIDYHNTGEDAQAKIYDNMYWGQTFTASSTYELTEVKAKMYRTGSIGTINMRLYNAVANVPSGSMLAYGTTDGNVITTLTAGEWVSFEMTGSAILTEGNTYTIVAHITGGSLGVQDLGWKTDTDSGYPNGIAVASSNYGASYNTQGANDLMFECYGNTVGGNPPTVVTNPNGVALNGIYLSGYGTISDGELLTAGFYMGTESGTYTDNYSANINQWYFSTIIASGNFTIGETYYFKAYASNSYGTGNGTELSFLYNPTVLLVTVDTPVVVQDVSGNFTASFMVTINPASSSNITFYLSPNYPPYTENINMFLQWSSSGQYIYSTWNGTYGTAGVLSENTTYYYQACVEYNGVNYCSSVGTFTTSITEIPDKPSVNITTLKDVSGDYNIDYVFEVTAKIVSSNTTDFVNYQGFKFSDISAPDGTLLPTIHSYIINDVAADNTFYLVVSLENASWYTGQTLYFKAFIRTSYYGEIYSRTVSITPVSTTAGTGETSIVTDISELVNNTKSGLGLTGIMGAWAFMGLILVLTSLAFGIGMASVPSGIPRIAIGVAWLLVSISIVGAFIFTGELGVWPIVILVIGVVGLIMFVVSTRLSGGGLNG